MRNTQTRFRQSELEVLRPRNGLEIGPRSSFGVHSAQLHAQIPNPPTTWVIERVRSHDIAN
eukprot:8136850-Alexandrium_andersonii.AAC.1